MIFNLDKYTRGIKLSPDQFEILHDRLKEEKFNIFQKRRELIDSYLDKQDTKYADSIDRNLLLIGLENMDEWKILKNELGQVNKELDDLYHKYLETKSECIQKKDKIIALKRKFGWLIDNCQVSKAANCTIGYARQFYPTNNGSVRQVNRKRISSKIRKEVLNRDENSCVMCDAVDNLQIHHIVPLGNSYSELLDNIDNLATLCKECHYLAHNGNYWGLTAYGGFKGGFWEWIKYSEKIRMEFLLKDIHGVGPVLINRIYERFGTLENLKKSNLNNLIEIKSINETLARRIKSRLS